jgi:hypothetical protein
MKTIPERPNVAAELSSDGNAIICGRCSEPIASLIQPGDPDYAAAVRLFGDSYPLYRLRGYLGDNVGTWRLSDRARSGRARSGREHGHRRPFTEDHRVGSAATPVIGWGHPRNGCLLIACPRPNRCGRINVVNADQALDGWEPLAVH